METLLAADPVWFCYLLECADGSFYVGIAQDLASRVKRHNDGAGAPFTAARRPVKLVWSERCGECANARSREKEIKGWSRRKKLELVRKAEKADQSRNSNLVQRQTAGLP